MGFVGDERASLPHWDSKQNACPDISGLFLEKDNQKKMEPVARLHHYIFKIKTTNKNAETLKSSVATKPYLVIYS